MNIKITHTDLDLILYGLEETKLRQRFPTIPYEELFISLKEESIESLLDHAREYGLDLSDCEAVKVYFLYGEKW